MFLAEYHPVVQAVRDLGVPLAAILTFVFTLGIPVVGKWVHRMKKDTQVVMDQVQNNHGSSLRDAIDRIEESVKYNTRTIDVLVQQQRYVNDSIDQLKGDVDELRKDI